MAASLHTLVDTCTCAPLPRPLQSPPDWAEILTYFRGSELQNYFQKILEDNMKAIIKPQYVDHIPKVRGKGRGIFPRVWCILPVLGGIL